MVNVNTRFGQELNTAIASKFLWCIIFKDKHLSSKLGLIARCFNLLGTISGYSSVYWHYLQIRCHTLDVLLLFLYILYLASLAQSPSYNFLYIYDDYVGQSAPACCRDPAAAIRGWGCPIYESSNIKFWNSEIGLLYSETQKWTMLLNINRLKSNVNEYHFIWNTHTIS